MQAAYAESPTDPPFYRGIANPSVAEVIIPRMTNVFITGAALLLMMLLFARALMAAWPRVVAEVPKGPCGFVPNN